MLDRAGLAYRLDPSNDDASFLRNRVRAELLPILTLDRRDDGQDQLLIATLRPDALRKEQDLAIKQNIVTLGRRVNQLGVAEPVIQQQGADRIVVQLPGVQDTAKAKEILGRTATLEVRLVDEEAMRSGSTTARSASE